MREEEGGRPQGGNGARVHGVNLVLKLLGRQGGWSILGNGGWKCLSAVKLSVGEILIYRVVS